LTVPPGDELASELYPNVAAVGAAYGDPTGKYATFLKEADSEYPMKPYFLWYQPFSDSGLVQSGGNGSGLSSKSGGYHSVWNASWLGPCVIAALMFWIGFY
jgi:hypothetical protein